MIQTNYSHKHDPAGTILKNASLPFNTTYLINHPADDNHSRRSYEDVMNLNQLHKANSCINCDNLREGKCKVYGYRMPYTPFDCGSAWRYKGQKA